MPESMVGRKNRFSCDNRHTLAPVMIVYRTIEKRCHPERPEGESKDLRTDLHTNDTKMRRFFDSLRSLRMT